LKVHAENKLLK